MALTVAGQLLTSGVVMSAVMILLWYVQWRRQDASLVDVAWSFRPSVSSIVFAATAQRRSIRHVGLSLRDLRLLGRFAWRRTS